MIFSDQASNANLLHWPVDFSLLDHQGSPECYILKGTWQPTECLLLLFSPWVMSDPLWPHGLQHAGLPCPSLSAGVCSNSSPLSQWCHPTIPSSVTPFSFCPQSFPASGSFPMSRLFALGDRSVGASASASVPPMNIQGWFPLGLLFRGS